MRTIEFGKELITVEKLDNGDTTLQYNGNHYTTGYFDLDKKTYLKNDYNFNAEILNCTGNIARNAETGEYMAHLHMLVGDPKGHTFGGHLLPGNKITVTGEFVIIETEETLTISLDDEFKLLLLNLE